MSFRFSSWTKVSLILLALHPFCTAFCDKKVPRGLGKSAKREGGAVNVSQSRFALGSRSWDVFAYEPLANRLRPLDLSLGRLSTRKSISGFTVFKGSGRQYCMQSIPLAVLKHFSTLWSAIIPNHCMQSIPLAVLKRLVARPLLVPVAIACNPYRLRYFFYFPLLFFKRRIFLWHNEAITKMFCWEG